VSDVIPLEARDALSVSAGRFAWPTFFSYEDNGVLRRSVRNRQGRVLSARSSQTLDGEDGRICWWARKRRALSVLEVSLEDDAQHRGVGSIRG